MATEVTTGRFRVWATRGGKRVASQNCGTMEDVRALKAEWVKLGFEIEVIDRQTQPEYACVRGEPIARRLELTAARQQAAAD